MAFPQLLHYPWKYLGDLRGGAVDVVIALLASHSDPKFLHKVGFPLMEV